MCSPRVTEAVRRAAQSSPGRIDRRRLIGAGAAAVASAAIAPVTASAQDATPLASPEVERIFTSSLAISAVYDLTHVASPTFPMYVGAEPMQIEQIRSIGTDGFYKNRLTLDEHTGTHIDAPAHFVEDGTTAENLDPARFLAPLCVVDISVKAASDPDAVVEVEDLAEWESTNGVFPDQAFVAMYSGWAERLSDPESYVNLDADGVQHFPGFSGKAAAFLAQQRSVVGIGTDTLSLDPGNSTDFRAHINALTVGLYGIENLANLETAPVVGTTIIVGGPKHERASGGPARVFAIEVES